MWVSFIDLTCKIFIFRNIYRWSYDSVRSSNSTVLHWVIKIVDLQYNTCDKLICFYLGKQIYNTIEYAIVTLCNASMGLFSAIIGLKHPNLKCDKHMYLWRTFGQSCQRRIKAAIQIFERLQTTTYIKFDLIEIRSQITYWKNSDCVCHWEP